MAQKKWTVEEKLDIVLSALRGDASIAELCRTRGVSETTFYKWRDQFLEAGREGLANGNARVTSRERSLERENEELKKTLGELTLQNRLLKKLEELSR